MLMARFDSSPYPAMCPKFLKTSGSQSCIAARDCNAFDEYMYGAFRRVTAQPN